jgi:uncharacterized cupin superfamily protein
MWRSVRTFGAVHRYGHKDNRESVISTKILFGTGTVQLNHSAINPEWILEGSPVSRNKLLSTSADGTASTLFWDCTAGRFNWFYDVDETACVLEGSVTIKDQEGFVRRVVAGDWIYFPKGSRAEWTVDNYVRKMAFCRSPLAKPFQLVRRVYRVLKKLTGRRDATGDAQLPAMFQDS